MDPADELIDLVTRGIPLAARYPDHDALVSARSRFVVPADLRHLARRTTPRSSRPQLPLTPTTTDTARRPKVAIASPDIVGPIRNGGIGTAYTSLARTLAGAGHDVTILYTLGRHCENGDIGDWVDRYRKENIHFEPLPDPDGPLVFHGPRVSFEVYQWLKKNDRFDVVHFPEWCGTAFCSVKAKRLGLAFEDTLLCVGTHSPTLWHDLADWRTIDSFDQLERDFLERQSVEYADVVVSPSQYLLGWMDKAGWALPERSYVQPYISPIASRSVRLQELSPVEELAFFGRLESRKGVELFCDAIDTLARAARLHNVTVTFLGKVGQVAGRDGLDYVRERASGWTHRWQALVDRSQSEAVEYLVSRRVLAVMPSLADNTPNTVLECLAAGIPLVSSTVGGIPEMVAEEDHERSLVQPDAKALAEMLTDRLEHGARPSRARLDPDDSRHRWIAWHEQVSAAPSEPATARVESRPLVSVCMATRDRPAFLKQALESLREQTYHLFDVVLVDDGSETQEAKQELDGLEQEFRDRGWTLLRERRLYPGAARNLAAAHARGRYLLFMDDDNLSLPLELETLVRAAECSGAAILTCGHDAFEGAVAPKDRSHAIHRWMPIGAALPLSLFVNCVGDTNMLVGREAFFRAGGFDEERGAGVFEDWAFFSKAMVRGLRIELVPEVLYLYRLGPHGFGQRAHPYESYLRPVRPFVDLLPAGLGLAVLYAAGVSRRGATGHDDSVPAPNRLPGSSVRRLRAQDRIHAWLVRRLGTHIVKADEGEHLRSRFEAGVPVDIFGPNDLSRIEALHQVEVSAQQQAVVLRSSGDEPQLLLKSRTMTGRGPFLIKLDVTARVDTIAQFFWKTPTLPVYCEPQSIRTRILAGRNVRYVWIPATRVVGAIRFDPATVATEMVLHQVELRFERDVTS